jgi:predicted ATPase
LAIKPITILCGTNSCGKSSILQSLLLIKQTLESKSLNQNLLLNGRFIHLGTFENIIFEKDLENKVVFDLCFKFNKESLLTKNPSMPFHYHMRGLLSEKELRLQSAEYIIRYKIVLNVIQDSNGKGYLKRIITNNLSLNIETKTKDNVTIPGISIDINIIDNDSYKIRWKNLSYFFFVARKKINKHGEADARIDFANLIPTSIHIIKEDKDKSEKGLYEIDFIFHRLSDILQYFFSSYTYIGPLREEPSRRYIYEDEITEIGIKGENAAYIYLAEQDKKIGSHYFYFDKNNSFSENTNLTLKEAVSAWLNLMNINDFNPEPVNEIIYLNLSSGFSTKTRVNIADVGFGVSQIFPIILEGLRMPKGNTLLLEQPEIHLHPNLQMQMADYFIALALSNKRVIVETHSDHVINRLVRRIVEDEKLNLKELIAIYFIKLTENGSIYEEIIIDDKRGIVNWPNDFFDQTAIEQEKILKAGLKKRNK